MARVQKRGRGVTKKPKGQGAKTEFYPRLQPGRPRWGSCCSAEHRSPGEDWSGDDPGLGVTDMEPEGAAKQTHPEGGENGSGVGLTFSWKIN